MEKKRLKTAGIHEFPSGILLLGGFLLGVMLPNIIWRAQWRQDTISSMYLLSHFTNQDVAGFSYFLEVLRMRVGFAALCILCGFSIFGVPLAFLSVLLMGVEIGALLSMSVLQFGLAGGAVGLGLLFPHYLLYLPANLYLSEFIHHQSLDIWRNRGLFPEKAGAYLWRAVLALLVYGAGVLLESFANPLVVEKLTEYLPLF